jgi:CubicO group peptidase (beta-lactamase class C family)
VVKLSRLDDFTTGIEDQLSRDLDSGIYGTGFQATLLSGSRSLVCEIQGGTDGCGRPVGRDTLFPIHCAGKPLVAILIAELVAAGALAYDSDLTDCLDTQIDYATVKLGQLLDHSAGLHRATAVQDVRLNEVARQSLAARSMPPQGWDPARHAAYSEVTAWKLLGMVLERSSKKSLPTLVDDLIARVGATGEMYFGFTPCQFEENYSRIGINVAYDGLEVVPCLAERTRRMCVLREPGYSVYASTTGIAKLYAAVMMKVVSDGPSPLRLDRRTALRMTSAARPSRRDRTLQRVCGFGYGFMTQLEEHMFGRRVSAQAFGHSGRNGTCFAFADPVLDLVVSAHWNGIADATTVVDTHRPHLVEKIYRDLQLET